MNHLLLFTFQSLRSYFLDFYCFWMLNIWKCSPSHLMHHKNTVLKCCVCHIFLLCLVFLLILVPHCICSLYVLYSIRNASFHLAKNISKIYIQIEQKTKLFLFLTKSKINSSGRMWGMSHSMPTGMVSDCCIWIDFYALPC